MRRTAAVLALAFAGLAVAGPAHAADPPTPGGCQAFGENVAFLGQLLGADFGATASGVATSEPGAFPELVVQPEQERECS